MPTDFHYVPQEPEALSGRAFISQTEQAFNELGTEIDTANTTADSALSRADNALSTANEALNTANTVLTSAATAQSAAEALAAAQNTRSAADNAQTTADTALTNAGTAQSAADTARTTADAAYDAAANARTMADAAQAAADTAQSTADTAQTAADTARQTADSARLTAGAALSRASSVGIFTTIADDMDADELYTGHNRLYVTSENAANLPVSAPAYLEITLTDDGSSVLQICRQDGGTQVFTRFASVNASDPENPVISWTEWNSLAMPDVLHEAGIVVDPEGQTAGAYLVLTFATDQGLQSVYIDVSRLVDLYTSGNSAIAVSADNRISLALAGNSGLTVSENGLAVDFAADSQLTVDNTSQPPTAGQLASVAARTGTLEEQIAVKADITALNELSEAKEAATRALSSASLAIQLVDEARGVYTVEEEAIDADAMYVEPSRIYAKNATSTGLPSGIAYPFYLAASITSDFSSATQIGWTETAPETLYIRAAHVTPPISEEDPYTAVWSPWANIGGGGGWRSFGLHSHVERRYR